jgi:hypothetical protein
MEKKELEQLHDRVSKERQIAEKKLREAKKLHEECEEEFNARTGFLYAIERLLNLKE